MDQAEDNGKLSGVLPVPPGWGKHLVIGSIVVPVIATVFVLLRIASRRVRNISLDVNDHLTIAALPFYYGQCVCAILSVVLGGTGRPVSTLSSSTLVAQLKIVLSIQFGYCTSLGLVKVAVCTLLYELFRVKRWAQKVLWTLGSLTVVWVVMNWLIALLVCRPISKNWDPEELGQCGSAEGGFIAVAVMDVVIDLGILAMPIPIIWSLQMPVGSRLGVMALFLIGALDMVIGMLRVIASTQVDFKGDLTKTIGPDYFWSILEPGMAIIVTSAIVLQPLLEKVSPRAFRSFTRRDSGGGARENRTYSRVEQVSFANRGARGGVTQWTETVGFPPSSVELGSMGDSQGKGGVGAKDAQAQGRAGTISVRKDVIVEREAPR